MAGLWKLGAQLALALIIAACSRAPAEKQEASSAAGAFYKLYLKLHPAGIPEGKQLEEIKPLLSSSLRGLLNDAAAAEASYAKATKGESPPLIEGDLFTSLFEGAEASNVGACKSEQDAASCLVELSYTDQRDKSKIVWQDRVYLVRESGNWLVDDIEFLGTWEFMHKGRLKELLSQVIEEAKDSPE